MMEIQGDYTLIPSTLERRVTIRGNTATVREHVAEALGAKFSEHPDILADLFRFKPARQSMVERIGTSGTIRKSDCRQRDDRGHLLVSGPMGEERSYVVRFVGDPIIFYKYSVAGKSAICADPSTCPVKKKYNIEPQVRHAVNLISRDDGKMYVVEVPPPVFNPVATWAKRSRQNPGGLVAVDFSITVKGDKKCMGYEVVALASSTLTNEEQQMRPYDLAKLFTPTPSAEIETRLFGDSSLLDGRKKGSRVEPLRSI